MSLVLAGFKGLLRTLETWKGVCSVTIFIELPKKWGSIPINRVTPFVTHLSDQQFPTVLGLNSPAGRWDRHPGRFSIYPSAS